jgi:ascorbate-specific PTS system EIIC-type component UlaA
MPIEIGSAWERLRRSFLSALLTAAFLHTIVGVLMILFGAAEVITAFTHKFFGISTALGAVSAVLAAPYTQLPGYSSWRCADGLPRSLSRAW